MVVMMVPVRNEVKLCQVKAYHADLTVVSLCMTTNETMCPNLALMVVNEMHSSMNLFLTQLTRVTVREGLDRGLRINSLLTCQLLLKF